jgi:hypothetical protein
MESLSGVVRGTFVNRKYLGVGKDGREWRPLWIDNMLDLVRGTIVNGDFV